MQRLKFYFEKYKILITIIVIIMLFLICFIYNLINSDNENIELIDDNENQKIENISDKIMVDIKGSVQNPGVYEVDSKCRVIDVIEKAGGLKDDANTEYLNLGKIVTDEMVIIIYSNDDIDKFKKDGKISSSMYECNCPDNINNACIDEKDKMNTSGSKNETQNNSLISINTATLEELMTLKGIGEAKAKAIIEYRTKNGGFKSLDELMNISGIGEAVYSKIKDYIKL